MKERITVSPNYDVDCDNTQYRDWQILENTTGTNTCLVCLDETDKHIILNSQWL